MVKIAFFNSPDEGLLTMTTPLTAHVLGLPRLGPKRQYKWALEKYWASKITSAEMHATMTELRQANYQLQVDAGLDLVTAGDFAYYDHILQLSELLGVIPPRHANEPERLARFFAMARGGSGGSSLEMKKWLNTNYHYMVPELSADQEFTVNFAADGPPNIFTQCAEAATLGKPVKAVLTGPLSYLYLAKLDKEGEFAASKLALADKLATAYAEIVSKLADAGVAWLQLDEPMLSLELPQEWRDAMVSMYATMLAGNKPQVIVANQYGALAERLEVVAKLPIDGLHLDLRNGIADLEAADQAFADKVLSVGAIDGRNVWRANLPALKDKLSSLVQRAGGLWIGTSSTLLHVPVDASSETELLEQSIPIAFAKEKVFEVAALARSLAGSATAADEQLFATAPDFPITDPGWVDSQHPLGDLSPSTRGGDKGWQNLAFPTTTIGSLPQTKAIRAARAAWRKGELTNEAYEEKMREEISYCVTEQEKLGLDILVHGECERNDMVEYFAYQLDGISAPANGWVQSYGSRATRPPLIHGDITRPAPMTVQWSKYAQSLTEKPMKGMLTGPVTIICWSFPRADVPRMRTGFQLAESLKQEVTDLAAAGLPVIQVDEPALREGLPLAIAERDPYLAQAVAAFNHITAECQAQIHTHMCYGEFNDVAAAISAMDADVISLETSRTDMAVLAALSDTGHTAGVGPGVYDVHSPRVPAVDEMVELLKLALKRVPAERMWVNPDCGLKTRGWEETRLSLANMVAAAQQLRGQ